MFGSGLNTDRDKLCIDFDKSILEERMEKLFSGNYDELFKIDFNILVQLQYFVGAHSIPKRSDGKHIVLLYRIVKKLRKQIGGLHIMPQHHCLLKVIVFSPPSVILHQKWTIFRTCILFDNNII